MKNKLIFSTFLVFTLILTACGTAATPTSAPTALPVTTVPATALPVATVPAVPATSTGAAPATTSGPAVVFISQNATLGSILVDSNGYTLYIDTLDTPSKINCTGNCATNWPPLLTNPGVQPTGGMGMTGSMMSMMGTIVRPEGLVQVTYNGWPLYYFYGDNAAGAINGEGQSSIWYAITPQGIQK